MKKDFVNSFFYKTLFIVTTGLMIKVLGLLNKIIITRLLGTTGMALYIMAFPTILLLINISSFSLNITISKIVSENTKTHNYSEKRLIKQGFLLSTIISIITIIGLLVSINIITSKWLNNENLLYPILSAIFLIPLVGLTDTLKGFFNGRKQVKVPALASFIEQIFRILFSIVLIYVLLPYGVILATTFSLIALSIGEMASLIYLLIKIKKYPPTDDDSNKNELKTIFKLSFPATLTRIIGSITYFLEPIIYTTIFINLGYNQTAIETKYTIINAYTIPLLTSASFLSIGLSTALIPHISENYALKDYRKINYYIEKAFQFALVPGILISILLFLFPVDYMKLIYGTNLGTEYIKKFAFIFIIYYLQAPASAILQAIGRQKTIFLVSTIMNILKIVLIVILSYISSINLDSILYAIIISALISTIIIVTLVIKQLKYKFNLKNLVNILLISIITVCLGQYFKVILPINFFLISVFISIIYLTLSIYFKTFEIKSISRNKKAST